MNEIISIGIFKEHFCEIEEIKVSNLIYLLNPARLLKKGNKIHTYADPFLFEHQNILFLFAEIQENNSAGYINCWKYENEQWQNLGEILKATTHFSYPFVFEDKDGSIYLVPESTETEELNLWVFDNFPKGLRKKHTLLKGSYVDSNIISFNDVYYLFTTNKDKELVIFFSKNLISDTWTAHPGNPISKDPAISRNGGGVFFVKNQLIRVAQNCSQRYGGGIVILNVEDLSMISYSETIRNSDFTPQKDYNWQKTGRHHLSICKHKSHTFVAIDGYASNTLINRFIKKIAQFFEL